jgi:predicted RNase H-like HicB family nuclease
MVYALVHDEKGRFGISFPDFPGCVSGGRTVDEAIRRGKETLAFHVAGMIEDGDPVPAPRSLQQLRRDPEFAEEAADVRHVCVVEVPVDLPSRALRVNISIEEGLLTAIDRAAGKAGQSRSAFLADAARKRLKGAA